MKEARELLELVNERSGKPLNVSFTESSGLPFYTINGKDSNWSIAHASTPQSNCAAFAVGRIAQIVFNAKFVLPTSEGLVLQPFKSVSANETFTPKPHCWVQNATQYERYWMNFHHISFVDPAFHRSTFKGIALKYPHLAANTGQPITEYTKLNWLRKEEIAEVVYKEAEQQGMPDVLNLWPTDGHSEDQDIIPMPAGLSAADEEYFKKSVSQCQPLGTAIKITSASYKANIRKWLPFDAFDRLILTPVYLDLYAAIAKYFRQKGATCRFRIFAYSSYYTMPQGVIEKLPPGFDLYYVTRGLQELTTESITADQANLDQWAKIVESIYWRPNLWYAFPLMPYTQANHHTRLVRKFRNGKIVLDGYSYARAWFSQGFNYYTMARMQAGLTYTQASEEWFKAIGLPTRLEAYYKLVKEISRRPLVLPKNTARKDLQAIPLLYNDADIDALEAALGKESSKESYLYKWHRAGYKLSKAAYQVAKGSLAKEKFYRLAAELNTQYPGLYVSDNLLTNLIEGKQTTSE